MKYNKHDNDFCTRGSYFAFLKDPFKPTQSQKYFKKYFEVYESVHRRTNPRFCNRYVEGVDGDYGMVLQKIFDRRRNTRKGFYKKLSNRSLRHEQKNWLRREAFDIYDLKNDWELVNVPVVKYVSLAWYID